VKAASVLLAFVLFAAACGHELTPMERFERGFGEYKCVPAVGLPGGAVGKYYWVLGTDVTPVAVEGRIYRPGDYMFLGYCGPGSKLIP
jgi:hypothetical protein